ncbi:MAG: peptidase T [Firmicutes bacterium]|nr:peptidase T [Bacillota bacterium]
MNLVERFLKYVSFETTSYEDVEEFPTSPKVFELGKYLVEELKGIGLQDACLDENGYVYAHLEATPGVEADTIGLMAHMDTSMAVTGANVKPRILKYEGGDIQLNPNVAIRVEDFPDLDHYLGHELIVTDGTTLLGADDKAGIAEIVTAVEYLLAHPEIRHGRLAICFNPDEETGRGTEHIDLNKFDPVYAYTLDGDRLGGIEYECFNGAAVRFRINGINIHPGYAKNKMKNAILIGNELLNMFPPAETPSHTEGYEGFYHVMGFRGEEQGAVISMIVRDHDRAQFEARKDYVRRMVEYMNAKYGEGTVDLEMSDTYYNMRELVEQHPMIIEKAMDAFKSLDIEPFVVPIRGGTDGAALTYMGIPTPNLSTGGQNFHGVLEFCSIDEMKKMVEVIIKLVSVE